MNTPAKIIKAIEEETDKIWLNEPEEIKKIRLGVFPSGAGSYGQYFSNLVFINGDMRALATWITPGMVIRCLQDDSFTLEHCLKIFAYVNLVNVDFLAYCGFVKMGEFIHAIVQAFPQIKTKGEFLEILKAWYAYANRMYLWVHQVFPWGLGTAFEKLTEDDAHFIADSLKDQSVQNYFEKYGPILAALAGAGQ